MRTSQRWEIRILNVPRPVYAGQDEREARMYHNSYLVNSAFLPSVTLLCDGVPVAEWQRAQ